MSVVPWIRHGIWIEVPSNASGWDSWLRQSVFLQVEGSSSRTRRDFCWGKCLRVSVFPNKRASELDSTEKLASKLQRFFYCVFDVWSKLDSKKNKKELFFHPEQNKNQFRKIKMTIYIKKFPKIENQQLPYLTLMLHVFFPKKDLVGPWVFCNQKNGGLQQLHRFIWTTNWNPHHYRTYNLYGRLIYTP